MSAFSGQPVQENKLRPKVSAVSLTPAVVSSLQPLLLRCLLAYVLCSWFAANQRLVIARIHGNVNSPCPLAAPSDSGGLTAIILYLCPRAITITYTAYWEIPRVVGSIAYCHSCHYVWINCPIASGYVPGRLPIITNHAQYGVLIALCECCFCL